MADANDAIVVAMTNARNDWSCMMIYFAKSSSSLL
jgi:hypothetical protein